MIKKHLLIFGGHSTGLEIFDVVKEYYQPQFTDIYNLVENEYDINSDDILLEDDLPYYIENNKDKIYFIISMTNQSVRYKCLKVAKQFRLTPVNIIHPNSYVSRSNTVGNGVYIAANVSISSNVKIHNHVIINYNTVIGHDAIINDDVIINPGVVIGGNVVVKERVIIGANSFILQGKTIGSDSSIDAMTYIDKDINSRKISSNRNLNIYP